MLATTRLALQYLVASGKTVTVKMVGATEDAFPFCNRLPPHSINDCSHMVFARKIIRVLQSCFSAKPAEFRPLAVAC